MRRLIFRLMIRSFRILSSFSSALVIVAMSSLLSLVIFLVDRPLAKAAGESGVAAVIATDGALVYQAPNEESQVMAQLPMGQAVRVSRGTTGSVQHFHKIRVGNQIGYIDALDVKLVLPAGGSAVDSATSGATSGPAPTVAKPVGEQPPGEGETPPKAGKRTGKKEAKKTATKPAKKARKRPTEPIFFTKFVGVEVGMQDYQEGIVGVPASTTMPVYGLKLTGPDYLLKGPVMDINILLHYGAPSYYNSLSSIQPNGFILWTDAMLVMPFVQKQNLMVYISGGPLLVYSKFGLVNSNRLMDLQALNLGLDGALGVGFRSGKIAFKLEAKYYVEKQSYKSLLGAIQTSY